MCILRIFLKLFVTHMLIFLFFFCVWIGLAFLINIFAPYLFLCLIWCKPVKTILVIIVALLKLICIYICWEKEQIRKVRNNVRLAKYLYYLIALLQSLPLSTKVTKVPKAVKFKLVSISFLISLDSISWWSLR